MSYSILQIQINQTEYSQHINENSVLTGEELVFKQFPEYFAYLTTSSNGSRGWQGWMIKHYTEVCVVEVSTLIEARQTELILVKVGDIIKDNIHNTYHMVESNGFSELVTFGREPRGLDINI